MGVSSTSPLATSAVSSFVSFVVTVTSASIGSIFATSISSSNGAPEPFSSSFFSETGSFSGNGDVNGQIQSANDDTGWVSSMCSGNDSVLFSSTRAASVVASFT